MINPSGVHFLLTYRCLLSCDHCFVWGDPSANVVFTRQKLDEALDQLEEAASVRTVYFEGGEPFLYFPLLLHGVRSAHERGYHTGIVSNGYWATSEADAEEYLRPFAGMIHDLSVSTDLFHSATRVSDEARFALAAADRLGIAASTIICEPGEPVESGGIMYRGRAAVNLAKDHPGYEWQSFTECPHERLADPGRVHLDPLGHVHLCQGISIGNIFEKQLVELFAEFEPEDNPLVGPLLDGGPADLVTQFALEPQDRYADACHLCYWSRDKLRTRFPEVLTPGLMYGEVMA